MTSASLGRAHAAMALLAVAVAMAGVMGCGGAGAVKRASSPVRVDTRASTHPGPGPQPSFRALFSGHEIMPHAIRGDADPIETVSAERRHLLIVRPRDDPEQLDLLFAAQVLERRLRKVRPDIHVLRGPASDMNKAR